MVNATYNQFRCTWFHLCLFPSTYNVFSNNLSIIIGKKVLTWSGYSKRRVHAKPGPVPRRTEPNSDEKNPALEQIDTEVSNCWSLFLKFDVLVWLLLLGGIFVRTAIRTPPRGTFLLPKAPPDHPCIRVTLLGVAKKNQKNFRKS